MGKVIDFLARVGSDAALRHASADAVRMAMLEAGIEDEELGHAVSAKDGDALRALMLMGQSEYFCSQLPAEPSHEEEDPLDGEDEDGDGEPDGNISRTPSPGAPG